VVNDETTFGHENLFYREVNKADASAARRNMSQSSSASALLQIATDAPSAPIPAPDGPRLPFHSGASLLEIAERENVRGVLSSSALTRHMTIAQIVFENERATYGDREIVDKLLNLCASTIVGPAHGPATASWTNASAPA